MEKAQVNEVNIKPITLEEEDEVVRKALERISDEERVQRDIVRQPQIARQAEAISRALLGRVREVVDEQSKD